MVLAIFTKHLAGSYYLTVKTVEVDEFYVGFFATEEDMDNCILYTAHLRSLTEEEYEVIDKTKESDEYDNHQSCSIGGYEGLRI